jgi:hypothetical protein
MKRTLWLPLCALLAMASLGATVADVQAVYLLPMSAGLDQYLANRLTGVFRVVTDPKLADAVFTDRLGEPFEQKLAELYSGESKEERAEKASKEQRSTPPVSSFGRGKGTIFLVDVKSRAVIWSGYQKSGGSAPDALNRTAAQIVEQIKKQQKPAK